MFSLPDIWQIVAICITLYAMYLQIRRPNNQARLFYRTTTTRPINRPMPSQNLTIDDHDKHRIESQFETKLIIWNAGNSVIRSEDDEENDPLRIEIMAGTVISHDVLKRHNATLVKELAPQRSQEKVKTIFKLPFRYLNPKDSIALRFVHSRGVTVSLAGSAIGLVKGPEDRGIIPTFNERRSSWILPSLYVATTLFSFLSVVYLLETAQMYNEYLHPFLLQSSTIFMLVGLVFSLSVSMLLLRHRRRGYPKDLEAYVENHPSFNVRALRESSSHEHN